jgi:Uma2 family endonuclease
MASGRKSMSSAAVVQRRWTYRDLVALPEDSLRHELLDGEHVVTPSPAVAHQLILWNLVREFTVFLDAHPIGTALAGPFDVKFSLFTVLVPDLVYFTAERFARVVNEKHAIAAPDLVVEILSPGTRRRDKGRKRAIYEREGAGEYWIVDPEAMQVTVLRRTGPAPGFTAAVTLSQAGRGVLTSPLFPGLRIPLSRVFR